MLTLDERIDLWFSGRYTPRERFFEAQRRTAEGVQTSPQLAAIHGMWRAIFMHEYAAHTFSPTQRIRLKWMEDKGHPLDRPNIMSFVYEYGLCGAAPCWIGKWTKPARDDIAFDCWARRTIEVVAGIEQSKFPEKVERWIEWFTEQLINYQAGREYQTEYHEKLEGARAPAPQFEPLDEIPI